MHVHFSVRHALIDVVDLRFDGGHVVLGATLQDELAPKRSHARNADDVLPDVLREHLSKTRKQLFLAETFLLKVHAVGVQEDRAAVAELWSQFRFERVLRVLGDGQAELIGHRLQEHAVAR